MSPESSYLLHPCSRAVKPTWKYLRRVRQMKIPTELAEILYILRNVRVYADPCERKTFHSTIAPALFYTHGVLDLGVKCASILFPDKVKLRVIAGTISRNFNAVRE